jgi:hypothetical protein
VAGNALSAQQVEQIVARLMSNFDANDDHRLTDRDWGCVRVEPSYDLAHSLTGVWFQPLHLSPGNQVSPACFQLDPRL